MGANGWRDAVAHKILEIQEDQRVPARRGLRCSWSPKGADGAERNPAEAASFKDEDRFRRLVEQLNAGVYIVAADGILTYVNPRFARNLRIPRQSGQGFRFDAGHRSDLIPATIPR